MLKTLSIKNFAIIENTSLSFDLGFNVLIGETGAGKSIILDALNFVMGSKPNKEYIRNGADELTVKATFINLNKTVIEKLQSFQIECDDVMIISRSFNIEGKSSCSINGEIVTVGMLKQIGMLILDFYGQNESVSILNTKNHIKLLDSYKPEKLLKIKENISSLIDDYKQIETKINSIGGQGEDRERLLDLLKYQIDEISNANIEIGEDEKLEQEISSLSNYEKISNAISQSYSTLNQSDLSSALSNLESITSFDNKLNEYYSRLNSAIIEIDDIQSSLKDYMSTLSFSVTDLDNLNERLEILKSLKKKYGGTLENVLSFLEKTSIEYDDILNSEEILQKLNEQKRKIKQELYDESIKLHNARYNLKKEIEENVKEELKSLGMKNTQFTIDFKPLKDLDNCVFTENGIDDVEFLFSANIGEEQKSLAKTISGGEMSRFMLSIKNVLNSANDAELLVFDEIDSGVSGDIGYKVGQKLAKLAKKYQVLCITHLAQVTALADNFIFISKHVENNETKSQAKYLDEKSLLEYLSTLFGSKTSEIAIMHSKELYSMAKEFKQSLNK